jgi:hypothetical protein
VERRAGGGEGDDVARIRGAEVGRRRAVGQLAGAQPPDEFLELRVVDAGR